jgi:hypothetical protein
MQDNNESNVHDTTPTEREDLKHTDTVMTPPDGQEGDPAGYEQSISPVGEVPPASDIPASSDDIPSEGDLVHPAPINAPVGKMPGM